MLWLMKDGEWAACQWRSTDMKVGGANTLQHVLKGTVSEGEESSGSWVAAGHGPTVIWLLCWRGWTSGEKFKTSISGTLHVQWLLWMGVGAAQTCGCYWETELLPTFLNSHFPEQDWDGKSSLLSCCPGRKEVETAHVKKPQSRSLDSCCNHRQRTLSFPTQPHLLLQTMVVQKPC